MHFVSVATPLVYIVFIVCHLTMYRAVKALSFVFIALACHAYGRRRDEVGQNNVGHKQRESKRLNPVYCTDFTKPPPAGRE